jgi:ABC-type uncharacterized transport system substrate-binding protein
LRDHGYVEGENIVIEHRVSETPKDNPAHEHDPDRRHEWRPDPDGSDREPGAARRQHHRHRNPHRRAGIEKSSVVEGGVPRVTRVAILSNPDNPVWTHALKRLQEAAPALGVKLQPLAVRDSGDLKMAFDAAIRERADALLVVREASFTAIRHQIADFAARRRLPAIYGGLVYVEAGALMSYGANILDTLRRLGGYVDKILKGAKPADLPVEQPTKFELLINMKTAKALGLTIPQSVLVRADKLIE